MLNSGIEGMKEYLMIEENNKVIISELNFIMKDTKARKTCP